MSDTIELDEAVRAVVAAFTAAAKGSASAITPELLNQAAYLMGLQSGLVDRLVKQCDMQQAALIGALREKEQG